jgi:hypothetical protein
VHLVQSHVQYCCFAVSACSDRIKAPALGNERPMKSWMNVMLSVMPIEDKMYFDAEITKSRLRSLASWSTWPLICQLCIGWYFDWISSTHRISLVINLLSPTSANVPHSAVCCETADIHLPQRRTWVVETLTIYSPGLWTKLILSSFTTIGCIV